MTGPAPALVQWALWGKDPDQAEYHLMRCSDGTLSTDDFTGLITRYSIGAVGGLPQAAVNWIPGRDDATYVAVAFHEEAAAGLPVAVGGRLVTYTRYFAVRYDDLAAAGAGYLDLALAVSGQQLPPGNRAPLTVPALQSRPRPAARAEPGLAGHTAALLLEGRPVCLTGAGHLNAAERLRFIDDVAALLPYGMRSRMSAATMASPTAKHLRFRLFFSSVPPESGPGGLRVAEWGRPETARPSTPRSSWYLSWLNEDPAAARRVLAGMTAPAGFGAGETAGLPALLSRAGGAPGTCFLTSPARPGGSPVARNRAASRRRDSPQAGQARFQRRR